ncbi:MAG: GNAT family N-acetyltransferase [Streptococcaceae bacterium]|jgi:predicted acetyltransferase|nr:GNAT family N-acetyltransferase [Streptococcaceae bacterium]MCH4176357.1 GNAT family N-acetyltransferase [Streptococcaceae bacterium]
MTLTLYSAKQNDLQIIFNIQKKAFEALYFRYKDDATSPYKETFEDLEKKFNQTNNHYFLIKNKNVSIGFLKITKKNEESVIRISPIAIIPMFEKNGYGKQAILMAEKIFNAQKSILSTIKQEKKLIRFYQSCGYNLNGYKQSKTKGLTFAFFEKKISI